MEGDHHDDEPAKQLIAALIDKTQQLLTPMVSVTEDSFVVATNSRLVHEGEEYKQSFHVACPHVYFESLAVLGCFAAHVNKELEEGVVTP